MRKLIPWWGRIGAKLILSRLPAGYGLWRRLNIFAHGYMQRADYALNVFQQHFSHAGIPVGNGFVALELGPGDSVSSAVIAAAHGATHTHLVDAGRFATSELSVYRDVARALQQRNLRPPPLEEAQDVDSLLRICRASYGTRGLQSLREIPSGSVDFIWSHAVLEHVRRKEFAETVREMRRIIRPRGICSHQVDLQDHLGGALNNMRIPSRWWESDWMACSGFYTNRLRMSEIVRMFESAGFEVDILKKSSWDAMPTPRAALAREFRDQEAADLLVNAFEAVLRPT